jgi:hypothetical protein
VASDLKALHFVPESAEPGDYSACSCGWRSPPGYDHWINYADHLEEVFGLGPGTDVLAVLIDGCQCPPDRDSTGRIRINPVCPTHGTPTEHSDGSGGADVDS